MVAEGMLSVLLLLLFTLFTAGVALDGPVRKPRARRETRREPLRSSVGYQVPVRQRWVQEPLIEVPSPRVRVETHA